MLEPQFFISPAPVPESIEFKVLGYARVGGYTLVRWRWGLASLEGVDLEDDTCLGVKSRRENIFHRGLIRPESL